MVTFLCLCLPAPVTSVSPAPVHQANLLAREPLVPTPEAYLGECGPIVFQCSLVFDLQSSCYPSDQAMIVFLINMLRGKASLWATMLWNSQSSILNMYSSFISDQGASKRLCSLCQGNQLVSLANIAVDFYMLATPSEICMFM